MPVLLHHSADAPHRGWDHWVCIAGAPVPDGLDAAKRLPDLAQRVEQALDECRDEWWALARALQEDHPSARLAHAACCNPSPSDMGAMLAWTRLMGECADGPKIVLALCDDPWLFRHLALRKGVEPGPEPAFGDAPWRMAARGVAARAWTALRMAKAAFATAGQRRYHRLGAPAILVYGHPASTPDGHDAYFGDLMARDGVVVRALHTDCPVRRSRELAEDSRTAVLHAWGQPLYALGALPFARWTPTRKMTDGPYGWLIRRAAAKEGAGGAGAMAAWQIHCQAQWLATVRPAAVGWPWENQPWERPLVREATARGVRTVGYLHTVVGHHKWNQSPFANADGLASVPETVLCNGRAYRDDLVRFGMPEARAPIGGAWRFSPVPPHPRDRHGAVFVALSSNLAVSREMLDAVFAAAEDGHHFLVKEHPMYPLEFAETERVRRTTASLYDQPPLKAVLFCASVVGLEALIAGLPTVRFRPTATLAVNDLPQEMDAPAAADAETLGAVLDAVPEPPAIAFEDVFAPVDFNLWRLALCLDEVTGAGAPVALRQ